MTHGIFCLRDENGFLVRSKELSSSHGAHGDSRWTIAKAPEDAYGWRPGLISLINTAASAEKNAKKNGQDTSSLTLAIRMAKSAADTPVDEKTYAVAMRNLRHEIRVLDVPEAKLSVLNLFVTKKWSGCDRENLAARGNNPPHQTATHAFDGRVETKWLDFSPQGSWIQYDFHGPTALSGYAITSAEDAPSRDPKDWQLLGSNDGGKTWTTLDSRTGEMWSKRNERRSFTINNKTAYRLHRLNISAVRDVKTANSVQISEIEFVERGRARERSRLVSNLEAGKKQTVVTYGTSLTKVGAWVDQLRAVLEQHYPGQVTLINGAQGGANSDWGRKSLDEKVTKHRPDTVFIEFAVNDAVASRRTSVKHARGNLESMIDRILKANPECEIILMVMNRPVAHTKQQRPNLAAYNQMYRDVARERNFQLIDHYPVWEKLLNEDPGKFLFYVPDTIHPVRIGALNVIMPTMIRALGLKGGKPEQNQSAPCWVYLLRCLMDKDKDGTVTREEFNGFWAKTFDSNDKDQDGLLQPAEFEPPILFRHLDANRDGQVALDELQKVFAPHFDRRDKNRDGVLTQGELPERQRDVRADCR